MIMKQKKVEVKKNFYYYMGKIADILLYPVLIVALVSSFAMFSANRENRVSTLFGHGIVTILSGSMEKSGFYKGDKAIIRVVDTDTLRPTTENREGDIIAFYYDYDPYDDGTLFEKNIITDFDNLPFEDSDKIDYTHRKTLKDVQEAKKRVYFHQIIRVYINEEGIRFFQTKGSSNGSADTYLIREDFVVGKYIETPKFVNDIISFCTKSSGMIVLVILPLSVLICLQMLSLLEQTNAIILERKAVEKRIRYDSEECINSNILIELRNYDKFYFYDVIDNNEKENAFTMMWETLKDSDKKKERKLYEKAIFAKQIYDKLGREEYWNYLIVNSDEFNANKLRKKYHNATKIKYQELQGITTKVYVEEGESVCKHWRKGKWI